MLLMTSDWVTLVNGVAWPIGAVVLLLILTSQRGRLLVRPLLRRLHSLGLPGGWSVELSEDAAAETKADVEGALSAYRPRLDTEFARLAHSEGVRNRLATTLETVLSKQERAAAGFRATVHIEDALVRNALYQLVDYWPRGSGAGRRFSVRFGALGRAWRLGASIYERDVPTDDETLITQWGMTREQAQRAATGKRSFVCVLLEHEGEPVGVVFIDAEPANAFQPDVVERFATAEQTRELAAAVGRVRHRTGRLGPGVKLLDDD